MINLVIEFLGLLRRLARRFRRKKKVKKKDHIICNSCGRRFDVEHIKASYRCAYCCDSKNSDTSESM